MRPARKTAASGSQADVAAAIRAAVQGTEVCIPADDEIWTTGIVVTKALTIRGAGIGRRRHPQCTHVGVGVPDSRRGEPTEPVDGD